MKYRYPGISLGVTAAMTVAFFMLGATQVNAQKEYCSSSTGNVGNGYHYEYWSGGGGSACMTVYGVDATFKATWSNSGDFLARIGLKYNETKTPDQIGYFSSDFAFTKSDCSGLTYIGIYGWTNNPLVEYYIIEDWVNAQWKSPPSVGTNKGTITVDSGTFNVYQNQRTGPSIHGNTTFAQYYSVRQKGRQSGHISISEHFSQWASKGMQMGKLYEVKLLVEGMNNGSGTVDFTKGTVVVGDPTRALVPEISRGQRAFFGNGNARGVLSLISLNGAKLRSMRLNGSEPGFVSSDNPATGMYFLLLRGNSKAPATRALLIE
ncbi:MAG: glycoside hydrolase family 11 protein [Chitinispirillaceae bacterium]|nr:glycoside hydrolase family 11 protein [Chitinispirillaceae bacterium]